MANIKIAQLTNATTIADTDIVLIEDATQTKKMTVANLKNLLGINSGGIVESGSTPDGNYIKYADGTMICRGKFEVTLAGASSKANLSVTFPSTFVSTDVALSLNPYGLNGDQASAELDSINCVGRPSGVSAFTAYIRYVTGAVDYRVNVSYMAIGRWKA